MSTTSLSLVKPLTATIEESWDFTHVNVIKFSYVWTINNFSFSGEKTGNVLKSPKFSAKNSKLKWCLKVYSTSSSEETKQYLQLYLRLVSCHASEVQANFRVSILNSKREKCNALESGVMRFISNGERGYNKFIHRDVLFDKANELITDDKLIICCEISAAADYINISGQNDPLCSKIPECSLSDDMEKLFKSKRFSDFILSINGQELFVHRNILSSRSPVFAAMFENEMEEKKNNRVEITDMDANVMKEMLRFVYTGKVPCVEKMAHDLLAAADKYALDRLKVICGEALCANMSVDTASSLLILADVHNANLLKTRTIDFIILHTTAVMATSGWKTVTVKHPHLVEEVLRALASQQPLHLVPPIKKGSSQPEKLCNFSKKFNKLPG